MEKITTYPIDSEPVPGSGWESVSQISKNVWICTAGHVDCWGKSVISLSASSVKTETRANEILKEYRK